MRYYYLRDDVFSPDVVPNRWHLDRLLYVNNWDFFEPTVELMEPGTWKIDVYQDGVETDFTINAGGLPIISEKVKNALSDLPEIQVLYKHTVIEPIIICNKEVQNKYFIMITEDQIDCVDEERSDFQKFLPDDPVRPDKAGDYDTFFSLVIDPEKVGEKNIFRIKRKKNALIVSEEVKKRFESVGATGVVFDSVMGDQRTIG